MENLIQVTELPFSSISKCEQAFRDKREMNFWNIVSIQKRNSDYNNLNVVTPNIYSINSTFNNTILRFQESERKETFMEFFNKFK